MIKEASFRDGTIEVDLAGQPASSAGAAARGFIGIAFRLQDDGKYEYIYLRPTNGRADDQVQAQSLDSVQFTSRISISHARGRRHRRNTSRMSISRLVSGRNTGS